MIITGSLSRLSLPLLKWCPSPIVLVEPRELEQYKSEHPSVTFEPLKKNHGGFSFLMNSMVARTIERKEKYFVFTDDDVTSITKKVEGKFKRVPKEEIEDLFAGLVKLAEEKDLSQLAVSFSGQSWGAKKDYQEPCGAWGVHITRARDVRAVGGYDETLPCFGDWDISARLLQSGFRVAKTNLVSFVHKMNSLSGGASDIYKKKQMVRDAAHRVAAKFPGKAKVVHVPEHGLDEVRFNWKLLSSRT